MGGGETEGRSTTYRSVPLARHREEILETPQLKYAVADQFERIRQALHGLATTEAIVKVRDQPAAFLIKTATVIEKWRPPDKFVAVERMKERCRQKPYAIVPDFTPEAAKGRLARFLQSQDSNGSPPLNQKSDENPFAS